MNEVLHANIFFVIASIATVVFCIMIAIVLYQLIKIMRVLRTIVERIEAASEQVAEDVTYLRSYIKQGGVFTRIIGYIMGERFRGRRSQSRKTADDD